MQPTILLLILAFVAGIQARDDWSWGPDESQETSSSSSSSSLSSSLSGRSSFFPSSSNDDHKLESSVQTEVIQPAVQRDSAIQTVRAPRLIKALQIPPAVQAVQTSPIVQAGKVTSTSGTVAPHVTGTNLKGESRTGKPQGDGQAEGRFLGLMKDKFCDYGIGFDCNKGYGHHGGSGISVYDVSYVQPIQVVPVGGPIAAVPVNKGHKKGHHQKAHHSAPAYHPPNPVYHPPKAPVSGYGAPRPTYAAPQPTYAAPQPTYGAPAPVYHAPKATYNPPASSYAAPSHSSYTPPKASYGQGSTTIVKHEHTHHHIYNGPTLQGGYSSFGKDNSYSASTSSNVGTTFKKFSSKLGNSLPAIPPRENFLTPITQRPAYLEDCQCVEKQYCSSFDIIGRSNHLLPLLDARSRKTDILSSSTDEEDSSSSPNIDDLAFSATKTHEIIEKPLEDVSQNNQVESQETERTKRDTLSIAVEDIGVEPAVNPTSRQGRQFRFNTYTPGLSGCAARHVCCRSPVFRSQRDISTCGRRSSVGLMGRVKNTRFEKGDTEFGEYPWQAAILRKEGSDNVYVCGAVLIDTRHLITAAHCVSGLNPSDLKVRLGEWDVSSETEFYPHIESPVSGVYTHPEFYSGNLNNDISVLRLFSPVDLVTSPHISPVCLPDRFSTFTGQRCHVTGWGKDTFGDTGDFQHLLKEVDVPIVGHSTCQSALRQTRLGFQFSLHEGMICAGGEEGKDACEGDGGSPLVCRGQDGSMKLAGLVSWGVGCGRRGVPGVYTNIPYYLTWIRSITRT